MEHAIKIEVFLAGQEGDNHVDGDGGDGGKEANLHVV